MVRTNTSISYRPKGDNKILIALMGVTGAGKSSLINALMGKSDVKAGHSLESGRQYQLT